jgi:hypothetical protein
MERAWTPAKSLHRPFVIMMATSMAHLIVGSGTAWAQIETCPGINTDLGQMPAGLVGAPGYMSDADVAACNATYGGCFTMAGSDTLTNIAKGAIAGSHACLSYHNVGSNQGEANMIFGATGANTGSLSSRAQTAYQGFAPMSRNFTSAIFANATVTSEGWAPTPTNVVAIDAGVITFQTMTGQCVDLDDTVPSACASACASAVSQNISALAVLIGGMPASGTISKGTTAECSDPCRSCIVGYLGSPSCQPVNRIEHVYRRDDKSGTQDTFREKVVDNGNNPVKFWCNGKSEGNNSLPGGNIRNEDLDPIRRGCVGEDSTHAYTRCTYYPMAYTCKAGDPVLPANGTITVTEPTGATWDNVNKNWIETTASKTYKNPHNVDISCTQGLIVALSENDPGSTDITVSIGNRVKNEPNGFSVGLAGLASATLITPPNDAVNINTITTDPGNIYPGAYKFSRRLFFMRNPTFADANGICTANGGNATAAPCDTKPGRRAEEDKVWAWSTTGSGNNNSCNLTPFIESAGFLDRMAFGCYDNCASGAGIMDEGVLLTCQPSNPGVAMLKQNVGAETETCPTCSSADGKTYPFVGDGKLYGGCWAQTQTNACSVGAAPYPASTYPSLM